MSNTKRVLRVLRSLLLLFCAVLLVQYPDNGYLFVVFILDVSLLLHGFRLLIYYFTMARFTVGGIMTLYKSIFVIDLGFFIFALSSTPQKYVMLYLIGGLVFSGGFDVFEATGARALEAASWRYQCFYGVVKILAALVCLFCLNSVKVVTLVYAAGLVHSAVSDMISAFRRTAIVYIE